MMSTCTRCGAEVQLAPRPTADARLLRRSTTRKGLCANCAVTAFLHATPLAQQLRATAGGHRALLLPHIQEGFARLMAVGMAHMQPDEIDWPTVVDQWDLPLTPTRSKKRKASL